MATRWPQAYWRADQKTDGPLSIPRSGSACLGIISREFRLKILHWEYNGFWLYYKRLEKGAFAWPKNDDSSSSLRITRRQLNWLLDGLSLEQRHAHQPMNAQTLI
ncbi:IS66 family insertion sequence element accessory protein TnpB [Sporolactobacillus nakayamae]|uniref:IS66 family insertion sequence element accessory protein TnpB n=1 Tax=Sporolactobacillus nakayamae TaxID=269670 RepID=UPI001160515D